MKNKKVLHTLIDDFALNTSESVAIIEKGINITFGQLKGNYDTFAKLLLRLQLKKGMVACLYFPKGATYVTSLLAVNKAGGIFMPMEPDYPLLRSASIINEAKPHFFITEKAYEDDLNILLKEIDKSYEYKTIIISEDFSEFSVTNDTGETLNIKNSDPKFPEINGDDSNYLLYTSGSTGKPKIIEGCHKSLSHFIHWEVNTFGLNTTTKVAQLAPITFDVSLRDIFVPLHAGGTLVVPEKQLIKNPKALLDWIINQKISLVHIVPSLFRFLMMEMAERPQIQQELKSLGHILLAGEALFGRDVEIWRSMMESQTVLVNLYGPSETTLAKIFYPIGDLVVNSNEIVPLGKALPNTHILIMNDDLLCGIGAVGEIFIKTPFRTKGYFKNVTLNQASFIQNPLHNEFEDIIYKTGDLGKRNKKGLIEFVGRIDKQVKIRGNRIELGEIEGYIRQISNIKQVVVKTVTHRNELVIVCYYTSIEPISSNVIQKAIDGYLPKAIQPGFYIALEEFPLNLNGKINQKVLPVPEELLYLGTDYQPPMTYLENEIAKIWSSVLGLKRVSTNQSFFALGGHSLSSTKIISQIHKTLLKEISVKEFFDFPTIKKQAQLLSNKDNISYYGIPKAPEMPDYPLSHAQMRLWIQNEKTENKGIYNMPVSCIISGAVQIDLLNEAFKKLIERHESLRTRFVMKKGLPRQKISPEVSFELNDHRKGDTFMHNAEIEKYLKNELNVAFDLNNAPLFRAAILPLEDSRNLLCFTIHHIISDAWSTGIIIDEILKYYKAFVNRESIKLIDINQQYKDYAVWHNGLFEKQDHSSSDFWRKRLKNHISPVKLPVDRPFSKRIMYTGKILEGDLSREKSDELRKLMYRKDTSLFVICLAALKVLLYKYSGQSYLSVGVPIAGRFHQDLESQIGMFLNYLVIGSTIESEVDFETYLEELKYNVFDALEHQAYPYDKLINEIIPDVVDGHNPFYDVLLVMNNSELNGSEENLTALEEVFGAEKVSLFGTSSKVALTLFISDDPELKVNLEYSDELFNHATAKAILENYIKLLSILAKEPKAKIFQLVNVLSNDNEQNAIVELSNETIKLINEDF